MKSIFPGLAIAGTLMMALTGAASAQTLNFNNNSTLERAGKALLAGKLETARTHYKRALRSNLAAKDIAPAYNNLCAIEFTLGNAEAAEAACSNAIGEDRRYWRAYVNRGNARVALGLEDQARSDFEKAVEIKPKAQVAVRALARINEPSERLLASAGN